MHGENMKLIMYSFNTVVLLDSKYAAT